MGRRELRDPAGARARLMRLLVPYIGELQTVDRRLTDVADFLGITWEAIPLTKAAACPTEYLDRAASDPQSCLVIHPCVMAAWVDQEFLPAELVSLLLSRFPYLLVHAPRLEEPFDDNLIAALSSGHLRSVEEVRSSGLSYEVSPNSQDVCG